MFGFLLAYSVILGGLPRFLRTALMTFSGVASNFAGIPLALAFVFTLGNTGLVTAWIEDTFGLSVRRDLGFNLYDVAGLSLTYMYFQFPLMVLIIAPAIEGLRREWREASDNLGASPAQYWRHVALPILTPAILGTMILLFGNAFGAQATAFQLTGGSFPLATLVVSAQIRGDVLHNPGLGYAMAMGMVVIMAVCILAYTWLQRRSERWLRS
jgi:putative spermidine/putrescine transport system permease protein